MNPGSAGYSWWYGASGGSTNPSHWAAIMNQQFDNKLSRISFQLGGMLVKDRLAAELGVNDVETNFANMKVKLFDYGIETDVLSLCEHLGLKVEHIKPFEAPIHLLQNKLTPNYFVILNGVFQPQPKEIFQAFVNFINEGGRILVLNCASVITASLFPAKIQPAPASTSVRAPIHVKGDKDLFTAFDPNEDMDLEYFRHPVDVIDRRDTKVLAFIQSWREEPLLVKSKIGAGVVYILVSKLFTAEKKVDDVAGYLRKRGASDVTVSAWQCAQKVNYKDAVSHAISAFPMMEVLGKILWREHQAVQQLFPPSAFPKMPVPSQYPFQPPSLMNPSDAQEQEDSDEEDENDNGRMNENGNGHLPQMNPNGVSEEGMNQEQ